MRNVFKSGQTQTLSGKAIYSIERKGALEFEATLLHEGETLTHTSISEQKAMFWIDTTVEDIILNQYIGKHKI